MKINSMPLANAAAKLNESAANATNNPIKSAVGQMESKHELAIGAKAIKAQDEMLGTVLDIKA